MIDLDAPTLNQVRQALDLPLSVTDMPFSGFSIDSRNIQPGNLFVAIRGPKFDGHDFLLEVATKGAVAAIVEEECDNPLSQIKVTDTTAALSKLASAWRAAFTAPVIGITGSNGKTTVKEMTASILAQTSSGLKTNGNFNNEIGVPLTLLRLSYQDNWAVIEMGASAPGEIAALAKIVKPDIALVNNVSLAHVEGFGSIDETANSKGQIYKYLPPDGVAVIDKNSTYYNLWRSMSTANKIVNFDDKISSELDDFAAHNRLNAAAATAICRQLGVKYNDIKQGLLTMPTIKGRLEAKHHASGAIIYDDTYNASPASVKAALDYLSADSGHKYFVLGDMGELGAEAEELHREIGQYAATLKLDRFITFGTLSASASEACADNAKHFNDMDKLVAYLLPLLSDQSKVLIKGSRFMRMDKLVDDLLAEDVR